MIVATAGHVDHGKTLLVKALTGVDADRLPEEKKRGMTIDLGFAYLPVEDREAIGFIDVPGHERFIHNTLCGVSAIDFALLVVAADDGPMPQTREHLAMLDLLNTPRGAVAITKIDRVSSARTDEVRDQMTTLLQRTTLEGSPLFSVSPVTGEGIGALKKHILSTAADLTARTAAGNFRMAVDRCFTIAGAGLVVTGTAVSGSLAVGDIVRVLDADLSVRVRTIHAQNTPSKACQAGQRCALNLAGPGLKNDQNQIQRGDWVVSGDVPSPVLKFDAKLRVMNEPLKHWTPIHLHLGASDITGRVALLEGSALVQMILDRPIGTVGGDRFIIRDQSARHTIGGGQVLDIFPPVRGRAKPERVVYLKALEAPSHEEALRSLLKLSVCGLDLSKFAGNRNLAPTESAELFSRVAMKSIGMLGFAPENWSRWKTKILQALESWHKNSPNGSGLAEERILNGTQPRLPAQALRVITAELQREGAIVKDANGVRLPRHSPALQPADAPLWKKVESLLDQSPLRPPSVHELARTVGEDTRKLEALLVRASRLSLLIRVSETRFFKPGAVRDLGSIAEELAAERTDHLVAAAPFRDRAGIGRNVSIEVLDYFDRIKFTRRVGDAHQILRPAAEALGVKGSSTG